MQLLNLRNHFVHNQSLKSALGIPYLSLQWVSAKSSAVLLNKFELSNTLFDAVESVMGSPCWRCLSINSMKYYLLNKAGWETIPCIGPWYDLKKIGAFQVCFYSYLIVSYELLFYYVAWRICVGTRVYECSRFYILLNCVVMIIHSTEKRQLPFALENIEYTGKTIRLVFSEQ